MKYTLKLIGFFFAITCSTALKGTILEVANLANKTANITPNCSKCKCSGYIAGLKPGEIRQVNIATNNCTLNHFDFWDGTTGKGIGRSELKTHLGNEKVYAAVAQSLNSRWFAVTGNKPFLTKPSLVNFVTAKGPLLQHTNTGNLKLNNSGQNSFFMTSDQGQGYQAEFTGNSSSLTRLGSRPISTVECQQPWGNPIPCGACAPKAGQQNWGNTSCSTDQFTTSFIPSLGPVADLLQKDLLNERDTQKPLNYVFLDTIVNNTNQSFSIAVTTAPLYEQVLNNDGTVSSAPNTIAGALDQGTINFINSIYNLTNQSSPSLTLGDHAYPITFLSANTQTNPDLRFSLFGKNEHNVAENKLSTKKHMASPTLALSTQASSGTQTIILYPTDPFNTCQPVIFIGRDINTNAFYILTYLTRHIDPQTNIACCQEKGSLCSHDTLYCSSKLTQNNGCAIYSVNTDRSIMTGTGSGSQARLKVVIDPMPDAPQYGYGSSIEVLPGLWWPGQPDFSDRIAPMPTPTPSPLVRVVKTKARIGVQKKG